MVFYVVMDIDVSTIRLVYFRMSTFTRHFSNFGMFTIHYPIMTDLAY